MDYRQGVPVPQATITHMTIEAQLTELRAMREDAAAEFVKADEAGGC